jgi:hypothetical protein
MMPGLEDSKQVVLADAQTPLVMRRMERGLASSETRRAPAPGSRATRSWRSTRRTLGAGTRATGSRTRSSCTLPTTAPACSTRAPRAAGPRSRRGAAAPSLSAHVLRRCRAVIGAACSGGGPTQQVLHCGAKPWSSWAALSLLSCCPRRCCSGGGSAQRVATCIKRMHCQPACVEGHILQPV